MACNKSEKNGLAEQNQDFRGQSIYYELINYPKTYFYISQWLKNLNGFLMSKNKIFKIVKSKIAKN